MKLLTFLLIAFCLQVSANSYAQKITLSGKNLSLEKIFRLIEKQTDYVFFFDEDGLQRARTVTINIKRATLSEALTLCFNDQPLTYNIIGTTIVVSNHRQLSEVKKIEELLPPPIEIKGRITDADGNPLQGVSVIVKGTVTGVTTDADGNYSISVPDNGSKILVFSFVGMEKQEVKLSGNTTLSITMRRVLSEQQEVVLVGYGTQKQINLTGAVATANSKVFSSRPITNVGQALQGVIANLNITPNSGAPGRGANFNVRGITSINGGGPLVLVDGVVMDPNLINPQDIASVTVLKDAASSAIYGARAAYGVILISTKSGGTNKKPVISLSSNYSINQPLVVPHYMNSIEWTTWMNDARMNSSGRPYFDDETMGYVKAYFNDPVNNPSLVQHSADPPGVLREVGNTDWGKELLKDSYPMQQHTMSISGGGEKVSYFTSLGYFNQKGITKPVDLENFNRFNITQNISYKVNNWITAKA
ncbi:MAG: SusC/RagA family TonB-linked outer membrane protein, partial [Bacteroidetes bacterium]|nr:SusC/RagA family TonB-linked outer membrane protein [Bacteroidota bacterium]